MNSVQNPYGSSRLVNLAEVKYMVVLFDYKAQLEPKQIALY